MTDTPATDTQQLAQSSPAPWDMRMAPTTSGEADTIIIPFATGRSFGSETGRHPPGGHTAQVAELSYAPSTSTGQARCDLPVAEGKWRPELDSRKEVLLPAPAAQARSQPVPYSPSVPPSGCPWARLTFVHHLKVDLLDDAGVVLVVVEEEQAVHVALVVARVVVGDVGDEDGQVLQVLGAPAAIPHHTALKALILLQLQHLVLIAQDLGAVGAGSPLGHIPHQDLYSVPSPDTHTC